jgi:hypothetical protein
MSELRVQHLTFIGAMIAADFALGMVVKNILLPTHILDLVRLDMIIPVALLLLTRQIVDRFGVLIVYELVWGMFAVFAMPAAFGLPGLTKLLPALANGIILDVLMNFGKKSVTRRFVTTAAIGSVVTTLSFWLIKLALGMPWEKFTQFLFGWQLLSGIAVWTLAAVLAARIWRRIENAELVSRLRYEPSDRH